MHWVIHYCDGKRMNNWCETSSTHSLLVVCIHKVLVPSPEVRHTLELGHSQDGDVPSVANQLFRVGQSLGFHIRHCSPCGELGKAEKVNWSFCTMPEFILKVNRFQISKNYGTLRLQMVLFMGKETINLFIYLGQNNFTHVLMHAQ